MSVSDSVEQTLQREVHLGWTRVTLGFPLFDHEPGLRVLVERVLTKDDVVSVLLDLLVLDGVGSQHDERI